MTTQTVSTVEEFKAIYKPQFSVIKEWETLLTDENMEKCYDIYKKGEYEEDYQDDAFGAYVKTLLFNQKVWCDETNKLITKKTNRYNDSTPMMFVKMFRDRIQYNLDEESVVDNFLEEELGCDIPDWLCVSYKKCFKALEEEGKVVKEGEHIFTI